jgi:hypothetical protein
LELLIGNAALYSIGFDIIIIPRCCGFSLLPHHYYRFCLKEGRKDMRRLELRGLELRVDEGS